MIAPTPTPDDVAFAEGDIVAWPYKDGGQAGVVESVTADGRVYARPITGTRTARACRIPLDPAVLVRLWTAADHHDLLSARYHEVTR